MLSNNNHSHKSCAVAEQIISYLYGETNPTERVALEAHLQDCSTCADEFANFGTVRSAVQEWRDVEFTNLETPRFEIQTDYSDKATVHSNYQVWLAKLREFFTRPVLATAALAIFVIGVGLVLLTQNLYRNDEVAKEANKQNPIKAGASPTIEKTFESLDKNSAEKDLEKFPSEQNPVTSDKKAENTQTRIARAKQPPANDFTVKIPSRAAKNNSDDFESNRNVKAANKLIRKSPTVPKPSLPLYSIQTEDDEDESVRLADLFDEIDSK